VDIVGEVEEIMNIKKEIKEIKADIIQEEYSHRPQPEIENSQESYGPRVLLREELDDEEDLFE
jgi:transcriptional/translational regulatory protein YebC/TACO1